MFVYLLPDGETKEFETLKEAAKFVFWENIKDARESCHFNLWDLYLTDGEEEYVVPESMINGAIKRHFKEIVVEAAYEKNDYWKKIKGFEQVVLVTYDRQFGYLHFEHMNDNKHQVIDQREAVQRLRDMKEEFDEFSIPVAVVRLNHGNKFFCYKTVYDKDLDD